jgi:hypothetical protein
MRMNEDMSTVESVEMSLRPHCFYTHHAFPILISEGLPRPNFPKHSQANAVNRGSIRTNV